MADAQKKKSWWKIALLLLVVLAGVGAAVGWYKFFREEPQPDWVTATPDMRFKYGSIGAENDAGIPYWIFFVLPRMFPEKLPGPGGYASLGVAWNRDRNCPSVSPRKSSAFRAWRITALPATSPAIEKVRVITRCSCPPDPTIRSTFRHFFASSSIAPRTHA